MARPVAFVLKGYPRLSETFIAQEIRALEQQGLDIRIVSLRHPTDPVRHPVHDQIAAPVSYLPEYLYQEPGRVWRAWRAMRRRREYGAALKAFLADYRRDPTPNRGRRFGQALVLAHELPGEVAALHAHFLHTPASVARYAALILGLPWSLSAHAKDVWTTPEWEKREKLSQAEWAVTCTAANYAHLSALAPGARIQLAYHGLDHARFAPRAATRPPRDGSDPEKPVRLLSVGRLVEKKGTDVLLRALARLPARLQWRLDHVGGGPLGPQMAALGARLGIGERIAWHGAAAQDAVLAHYRAADLFVLASRIAADGDRDGLPNVLMEALSQGLAVVSTEVSAIAELVDDGVTGRLVPPQDDAALAEALAELIADPAARARLGRAGQERVAQRFSMEDGIRVLARRFGLVEARPAAGRGAA